MYDNQMNPTQEETGQPGIKEEVHESPKESSQEDVLSRLLESVNIAEDLEDEKLTEIGSEAMKGYTQDEQSRSDWTEALEDWLKLAKQTPEIKSYPWQKASNVKYPLLSTAAMQFAARAYPALVPSDNKVVKGRVIGKDPTGEKQVKAERISLYMSYQLTDEMDGWEEDMDKLLIMLPVVGTVFKKTYWDPSKKANCSKLINPKNLVVNYWAKSLKEAERISEVIELSPRLVKERQLKGIFLDIDLGSAVTPLNKDGSAPAYDETTPHTFIEQHTFLDLDDDGYREPYIVTFHKESGKVVRITARWDSESIEVNEKGKVVSFTPVEYYTKFGFVPNPDGGFYDIGFGVLLGSLNESVNTLINQLIDAGSLSNLQSGFIGKGLRMRMGDHRFSPGEWKTVNATGDDLKKQIVPLPAKDPSSTLFQLMGSLISSGKELASVAEIFVGKMPGQNTPATTTMATIEQGMKVFTAVYKRLYRSLAQEYKKLYRLNRLYLDPQTYSAVLDMEVGPDDFNSENYDVCPGADPTAISQTERLMKAQGLMELLPIGILDPVEVTKRILQAQEQPNWEALIKPEVMQSGQMPPPPPDPKLMEMQMKGQIEQQKIAQQGEAQQRKGELEARDKATQLAMKASEHNMDMQHKAGMNQLQQAEAIHKQRIFSAQAQANMVQKLVHREAEHKQKVQQAKTPQKGNK
jgi:chaperonin GroES